MQPILLAATLAGLAFASPAPEPTPKAVLEDRQILGGGGGGVVGSIIGGLSGHISNSVLAGCIGGAISGKGTTLCTTFTVAFPHHSEAPKPHVTAAAHERDLDERQIAGSLGGYVGSSFISGTLSGEAAPTLQGCIGGAIPFGGKTICLGFPAKATPTKKHN